VRPKPGPFLGQDPNAGREQHERLVERKGADDPDMKEMEGLA